MKATEHSGITLRRHATQKICTGVCKPPVVAIVHRAQAKHNFITFKTEQKHVLLKQTTDKNNSRNLFGYPMLMKAAHRASQTFC